MSSRPSRQAKITGESKRKVNDQLSNLVDSILQGADVDVNATSNSAKINKRKKQNDDEEEEDNLYTPETQSNMRTKKLKEEPTTESSLRQQIYALTERLQKNEILSTQRFIPKINPEIQILRDHIDQLTISKKSDQEKIIKLYDDLGVARVELQKQQDTCRETMNELSKSVSKYSQLEKLTKIQIQELQNKLNSKEAQYKKLQAGYSNIEATIKSKDSEVLRLQSVNSSLEKEIIDKKAKFEQLQLQHSKGLQSYLTVKEQSQQLQKVNDEQACLINHLKSESYVQNLCHSSKIVELQQRLTRYETNPTH